MAVVESLSPSQSMRECGEVFLTMTWEGLRLAAAGAPPGVLVVSLFAGRFTSFLSYLELRE